MAAACLASFAIFAGVHQLDDTEESSLIQVINHMVDNTMVAAVKEKSAN
jgi:hypothetical protein